jgi:hypothetical protein
MEYILGFFSPGDCELNCHALRAWYDSTEWKLCLQTRYLQLQVASVSRSYSGQRASRARCRRETARAYYSDPKYESGSRGTLSDAQGQHLISSSPCQLSRHVTVAGTHAAESALGSKLLAISKAEHTTASSEGSPASACSGVHIRANPAERHQRRARPERPPGSGWLIRASRRAGRASGRARHASRVPQPFCPWGGTEGQRDRERTSYSTVQAGCGPWITTAGSIVGPWLWLG